MGALPWSRSEEAGGALGLHGLGALAMFMGHNSMGPCCATGNTGTSEHGPISLLAGHLHFELTTIKNGCIFFLTKRYKLSTQQLC